MKNFIMIFSGFNRTITFMIAAFVSVAYYGSFYDNGSTIEKQIATLNQELAIEKEKEKESDLALKEIAMMKSSVEALKQQFTILSTQLPRTLQMAEVIRTVDTVSKATNFMIRSKEPKSSFTKDGVETLPIEVAGTSNYAQLTRFVHFISSLERIYKVQSLKISNADFQKNNEEVKVLLEVASYRYVPTTNEINKGNQ